MGENKLTGLDEYQAEARRTAPRALDAYPVAVQGAHDVALNRLHDVLVWALGLAGEAGEVCDLLKKVHGHGKPFDGEKLKRELGDVLWYLSNLADAHGFTLSEVAQVNVEKLRARYPDGFTVAAAQAKADEATPQERAFTWETIERCVRAASAARGDWGSEAWMREFREQLLDSDPSWEPPSPPQERTPAPAVETQRPLLGLDIIGLGSHAHDCNCPLHGGATWGAAEAETAKSLEDGPCSECGREMVWVALSPQEKDGGA